MIELTINVEPTAKGRARVSYQNGLVRTYTPKKTSTAQELIMCELLPYRSLCFPEHIPVKLTCCFFRTRVKGLKKEQLPFRKPDLDNFLKLLMDSINGLLVTDDSQITTICARKEWSHTGSGYITMRLEEDR